MSTGEELLMKGTLHGSIAGITRKDWSLFYLELTTRHIHVFEGHEDPHAARKHLRSLDIKDYDSVVPEKAMKFALVRADGGNCTFKCDTEYTKQKWIQALKKAIEVRKTGVGTRKPPKTVVHQPPPHVPGSDSGGSSPGDSGSGSVRLSKMSMDSGLGVSDNGQVWTNRQHHSGSETHQRTPIKMDKNKPSSDSAMFEVREELDNYKWFWGEMNRADSETMMRAEGEVGNFAIRVNANGHYVMTFWRADGIHHHKIIHQVGIFRFEKTAVRAEGNSVVDLLDNYMKNCIDRKIVPFGGVLHLVYDEAWNPPEIDHDQLQRKLLARNDMKERRKFLQDVLQTPQPPSAPSTQSKNPRRKKEEYTVVSPTTGSRESELTQTLPPGSSLQQDFQQEIKFKMSEKSGKVAPQPPLKPTATQDGKKPPPKPPVKKKPAAEGKEVAAEPIRLPVNDKRNNPLPPTPQAISPTRAGSGGSSPKPGRPKPVPRGGGGSGKMTSSSSISPSWTDQKSSPTSPSPPPPEQAVYENTDFSAARDKRVKNKKKLPPTPPNTKPSGHTPSLGHTPSSVTSDPELDVGGQDVYENTAFGDTEDGGDLYANLPVSQQKKGETHNGHHSHPPYQNVGHSEPQPAAPDTGTPYQNIHYPNRGRRRKH